MKFNPLEKWLGIPAADQPPNHYRLLGIRVFEADIGRIKAAADARMAEVRRKRLGPNGAHVDGILEAIADARLALTDATLKARYDATLSRVVSREETNQWLVEEGFPEEGAGEAEPHILPPPMRRRIPRGTPDLDERVGARRWIPLLACGAGLVILPVVWLLMINTEQRSEQISEVQEDLQPSAIAGQSAARQDSIESVVPSLTRKSLPDAAIAAKSFVKPNSVSVLNPPGDAKPNKALRFKANEPGNPPIVRISTLKYDGISPWTIEAWVQADYEHHGHEAIFSSGMQVDSHFVGAQDEFAILQGGNPKYKPWVFVVPDGDKPDGAWLRAEQHAVPGEWHHVACQIDVNRAEIYVDGRLVQARVRRRKETGNNSFMTVGGMISKDVKGGVQMPFSGVIDELRVSSGWRYRGPFAPRIRHTSDEDTIALYHCDELRLNQLIDASGNEHVGLVSGAVSIAETIPSNEAADDPMEWTSLLAADVTLSENWQSISGDNIESDWQVANNVIRATSDSSQLISKVAYSDFELRLEWRAPNATTPKVAVRVLDGVPNNFRSMVEIPMEGENELTPDGFHTASIRVAGTEISQLKLLADASASANSTAKSLRVDDGESPPSLGKIVLSAESAGVEFRSIRIRPALDHNEPLENRSLWLKLGQVVEIPSIQFDGTTDLTAELWIKRDCSNNFSHIPSPLSFAECNEKNGLISRGLFITMKADQPAPYVLAKVDDWIEIRSDLEHTGDEWMHLAMTFEDSIITLFVDGEMTASADVTGNFQASGEHLRIGYVPRIQDNGEVGYWHRYSGAVDEIRISNTVRYRSDFEPEPICKVDGDTTALYHCDEWSGQYLLDSSSNDNHGQIRLYGDPSNGTWLCDIPIQPSPRHVDLAEPGSDGPQLKSDGRDLFRSVDLTPGTRWVDKNGIAFRWCPPGALLYPSGRGTRQLTIKTKGFWIGESEITRSQWVSLVGSKPWQSEAIQGSDFPATHLLIADTDILTRRLNATRRSSTESVFEYVIPSDHMWEYACRAGTESQWFFGDDESKFGDYAWKHGTIHRSCTRSPNSWGVFDCFGTVGEIVRAKRGRIPRQRGYVYSTIVRGLGVDDATTSRTDRNPINRHPDVGVRVAILPSNSRADEMSQITE